MQQGRDAQGEPGGVTDPGQLWMLQFQRGDDAAFRNIVVHYGARVIAFFRRAGADASAAEDLAQEAFLRIARARDRYAPSARFSTWLHRIVARIAMNDGTRNRWRRALPLGGEAADDARPGLPSGFAELATTGDAEPPAALTLAETRACVRSAVATLPEPQRTALLLHRFEECSYEEIGVTLGLSLPAVKSLLFRARENLKQRLLPLLREEVTDGTADGRE